jgi:hypothetical protein
MAALKSVHEMMNKDGPYLQLARVVFIHLSRRTREEMKNKETPTHTLGTTERAFAHGVSARSPGRDTTTPAKAKKWRTAIRMKGKHKHNCASCVVSSRRMKLNEQAKGFGW